MQKSYHLLALFLLAFPCSVALAQSRSVDAFVKCMERTKSDRLTCVSGCGMIIQGCYDEGITDILARVEAVQVEIEKKNNEKCDLFSKAYSEEAQTMERNVAEKSANLAGWVAAQLSLDLARQRLSNLRLIRNQCRG